MPLQKEWEGIAREMVVVRLGVPVQVLIPSILVASFQKRTRGLTFHVGRGGSVLGAGLIIAALALGYSLFPVFGPVGVLMPVWLIGTAGGVMMVTAAIPLAFVKPICTRCRLLPVIKEHEAIHLAGVPGEAEVWASMKERHSLASLALQGDPAICDFCPIPKRLGGA